MEIDVNKYRQWLMCYQRIYGNQPAILVQGITNLLEELLAEIESIKDKE